MNINIGKFRIESDRNQFTVFKERKKGLFPGLEAPKDDETTEETVGYYSTFSAALNAIPTKALLRSDCTTFEQVLDVLKEYRDTIKKALQGA